MDALSITELNEGCTCPPIPDTSVLETCLKDCYGLTASSFTPLQGYEDRNYHTMTSADHSNPFLADVPAQGFMVKVVNPHDSKKIQFVDSQRALMTHLNTRGIMCPTEVKNLEGEFFSRITLPNNGKQYVCVVSVRTYLHGNIVASHPLTPPLLYQLGAFLAQLHDAMQNFQCDFYDTFVCLWSLKNTLKVRDVLDTIQDPERRTVVKDILDTFEKEVQPRLKDCRPGQVHGDPNEQNILVVPDSQSPSGLRICGLLDFQESCQACRVYDLGAMAAYMMMNPKTDVLATETPGYLLAGYTSKEELLPVEWSCFRTLIASRMAMSLTYGAYVHSQNPTNDYILTTAQIGWSVLTKFWLTPKDQIEKEWKEIAKSYNIQG